MPLRWIGEHLMLKSKFIEAVLSGRKRATIRLGKVKVKSKEFYIHSGGRIIAKAVVEGVEYKRVKELTDEDAKLDGLPSREALIKELKVHYGDVKDDDFVTIIKFRVVERLNMPEGKYPPHLSPYRIAELALKHLTLSDKERKILEYLVRTKSLRRTAKKFYGKLSERWRIRRLLSRLVDDLVRIDVLKPEDLTFREEERTKSSLEEGEK